MPKPSKKPKAADKQKNPTAPPASGKRPLYAILPWACQHYPDHSEVKAYVPASGIWETVADVRRTAGASAETMADYLMYVVNNHEKMREMMGDMIAALELCLQTEGLTWEAEREAEITVRRAKEIIGLA
jgi:hypothetical protein